MTPNFATVRRGRGAFEVFVRHAKESTLTLAREKVARGRLRRRSQWGREMNRLNKVLTGLFAAALVGGICVSESQAANGRSGVRASADRVAKDVAGENPIRQDATRLYPEVVAEVNGEQITLGVQKK